MRSISKLMHHFRMRWQCWRSRSRVSPEAMKWAEQEIAMVDRNIPNDQFKSGEEFRAILTRDNSP